MLDRDAHMWALVAHCRYDCGLPIAPFDRANPGRTAQRRICAIGGSDQARCHPASVGKGCGCRTGRGFNRVDFERCQQRQTRQRARMIEQGAAQHLVLDDPAERRIAAELAMIVVQE